LSSQDGRTINEGYTNGVTLHNKHRTETAPTAISLILSGESGIKPRYMDGWMNPTSTIEPTRINYQIKNYNRNLQANSVSHHRRPDEEREQRERGARAGGREGGRSLYARRHGARWPGRRVSAGPWPACTAGTGSWRRRRRWSRACGRPRPGAAPRPSSSSAPSPPQARSRESIRRGEGGFACVCNLFPLFFLPHLRPPLFVFVTARTWASPICQRNTDRRLPSISFNPAGQRLTPHGGERSPLPFLSSSARSLSHASSPVGQSLLLLPLLSGSVPGGFPRDNSLRQVDLRASINRQEKITQTSREMRQNHTKRWSKGSEQLAGTAIQAKGHSCSDFSSILRLPVFCFLILSTQGAEEQRESTQQTENTRTDCYERQM
jgi:hypothetical protein